MPGDWNASDADVVGRATETATVLVTVKSATGIVTGIAGFACGAGRLVSLPGRAASRRAQSRCVRRLFVQDRNRFSRLLGRRANRRTG
jgi:hypothetical protein